MIIFTTKEAGRVHYWTDGYADNCLVYPDDYDSLVIHCMEMVNLAGEIMSDLGINDVVELTKEFDEISERMLKNG
jgi:hypothetical protein